MLRLLICLLLLSDVNAIGQTIPWKADYLLTWADFEGAPDPGSSYTALTFSNLAYHSKWDNAGNITVTVTCDFDKKKSWKRPERNLTPKLLLHEEMHFYLAELYARKMRQAFGQYTSSHKHDANTNNDITAIFNRLLNEQHHQNGQYDAETNHSINEDKQKEWTKKIVMGMKELSAYEVK